MPLSLSVHRHQIRPQIQLVRACQEDYWQVFGSAPHPGASDPEAFADRYTALLEGTLVLRQVHGRDDAARVIRPAAESLLAEMLSGEGEGRLI